MMEFFDYFLFHYFYLFIILRKNHKTERARNMDFPLARYKNLKMIRSWQKKLKI